MPRRTKIVATLGPATDDPVVLQALLKAGVDIVRINCSHGTQAAQEKRFWQVRECADRLRRPVGIMFDLQGPKIRIGCFKQGVIVIKPDDVLVLDPGLDEQAGEQHRVSITYAGLAYDVKPDDILLLDDGRLSLRVLKTEGVTVVCAVIEGGVLSNQKGLNRQGGGLTAEAFTPKDRQDLDFAIRLGVDFVALSFPRDASDILGVQKILDAANAQTHIIAKIERSEAIAALDDIIRVSYGVMVARGDLGVEIGDAELPAVQKHIINRARALNRVVITATQMMESMILNAIPTRAEVFDVANAVLDGTDAVMLSAETASGKNPVKVVESMARICVGVEKQKITVTSGHRLNLAFSRADEATAMAAMYVANHMQIRAIVVLTETGSTALWMSRIRSGIPIYALSRFETTLRRVKLLRGVYPIAFDVTDLDRAEVNQKAVKTLQARDVLDEGDWVVLARGDFLGVEGGVNTLKILRVGFIV